MQCYTELIPPSGVTHAVSLPFTSADATNLVVARTSLVQIFALKATSNGQESKLVLVAEYNLSGTVTSLAPVKLLKSKTGGDALLVSFRDAKLSLLEWDAKFHGISTISIHYYENEDLLKCPWTPDLRDCVSHLTVDPSSRCAAFNFGIGNLAIIPFHQTGDDLADEDKDDDEDEDVYAEERSPSKKTNGNLMDEDRPYASSFVLPLTMLEAGLLHPIHLAFLHEYREPTFGVLYSTAARSTNQAYERKDVTIYAVFSLDLEQKASTTLLSIQSLPNDLYRVIPLPLPVSGALLVGGNELVHVDQGGKTTAIGVNEFSKQYSSFAMADHSDYGMRLEGCQIEQMGNATGDMLIIFANAEVAVLSFRLDGRSVAGLTLTRVPEGYVKNIIKGSATCMALFNSGALFIGSEVSDSVLLGTTRKVAQLRRTSSRPQDHVNGHVKEESSDQEEDEEDEEDEDDDLYGEKLKPESNGHSGEFHDVIGSNLRLLDRLSSTAHFKNITLGKRKRNDISTPSGSQLQLAAACGQGRAGAVSVFSRVLYPKRLKSTNYERGTGFSAVWSFAVKRRKSAKAKATIEDSYNNHFILSRANAAGEGESVLYTLSNGELQTKEGVEFDVSAGPTIQTGTVLDGSHTVQVLATEVRVYDSDFGLAHIEPIVDEDSGSEARVATAHVMDPYIAIVKEDNTALLLKVDKKGELEEIELPEFSEGTKFVSASIFTDDTNFFDTKRFYANAKAPTGSTQLLTLLTEDGSIRLLSLPNIDINVFAYDRINFLPSILANDISIPKHWRYKETLVEALIANLGDRSCQSSYLILRTSTGEVALYEPFQVPETVGTFRFRRTSSARIPRFIDQTQTTEDESSSKPSMKLRYMASLGGLAAVGLTGTSPALITKTSATPPRIHALSESAILAMSGHHDQSCSNGFVYLDAENSLHIAELPEKTDLGLSEWTVSKTELNEEVSNISYFPLTSSYIVTTNTPTPFHLPTDDEWHPEWATEPNTFPPTTRTSTLKLLSSQSQQTISSYQFENGEQALCLQVLNIEISETSHERKDMIVVGTSIAKGENVPARGSLYIFDVADVVPTPNIPESNLKLKLVAKEEVKGAITAISSVGTQGFILAVQGQKTMVRGLKEDKSILPVAFMDMRYYVHVAKTLATTGLTILGDAVSGLWLVGYSEEPYKLQLIGSDQTNADVLAADFLPDGKQLFLVTSDGQGDLCIMQYDPENPKSERGLKLLRRSTFHTGAFPTSMALLPRTPVSSEIAMLASEEDNEMDIDAASYARHQILLCTQEGSLALITPLSDQTYRRLSTLQNLLISNLEQPCGLNARAYRDVQTDGIGGRAMIDGNVVMRWLDQSSQHQASTADKIGGSVWDIRGDLEAVGGGGLGYL
jgi:cleavage and polyadenylation specificity factor subunit 1